MAEKKKEWQKKAAPYRNRIIWSVVFLIVSILFLTLGFWRTFLIAVLVTIGFGIGYMRDQDIDLDTLIDRFRSMIGI